MLQHDQWTIWLEVPQDLLATGRNVAHKLSLQYLADYHGRIMTRTESLMLKLLFFAWKPHTEACCERKEVASEILNTEDAGLHPTVWKIKGLFRQSIKHSAETGKCCMPLYTLMRMVSLNWDPDSQDI